jgi:2-keto-4-pentenoate hydratase/2-oxohepta-3-ene-1,7-dioic acid hydratase in catechol pathway
MKIASFIGAKGNSYGVVTNEGVIGVGAVLKGKFPDLQAVIAAAALGELEKDTAGRPADIALKDVKWLSPIVRPGKIWCVGLNYRKHAAEAGAKIPDYPSVFTRFTDTLAPHGSPIVVPRLSGDLDYECELAIVVGRPGRHIPEAKAFDHVAGYTCFNDASVRDYQFQHSLAVGKNFAGTGGIGPWIVTRDRIPDPSKLTIRTRLNGQEVQYGTTDDLIFTIPQIVAYLSGMSELAAGDIIATGTPHGVGFARKPPLWMKPGDVVEVDISEIGVLLNPVIAE